MNTRLVAAFVAALVMVSPALAADLLVEQPPVDVPGESFDWEGAYVGVHTGWFGWPDVSNDYGVFGVQAGYNFMLSETVLAGIRGSAEYLTGTHGDYGHFAAAGRLGVLATDDVLIYGLGELGVELAEDGETYPYYGLGAGVEIAVSDSVSVQAEVIAGNQFEDADSLFESGTATVGVNFHF